MYVYCTYMLDKYIKTHDVVRNRCIHICIYIYMYIKSLDKWYFVLFPTCFYDKILNPARESRESLGETDSFFPRSRWWENQWMWLLFSGCILWLKLENSYFRQVKNNEKKMTPVRFKSYSPCKWWWQDYFPCGIVTYFSGAMKKTSGV